MRTKASNLISVCDSKKNPYFNMIEKERANQNSKKKKTLILFLDLFQQNIILQEARCSKSLRNERSIYIFLEFHN